MYQSNDDIKNDNDDAIWVNKMLDDEDGMRERFLEEGDRILHQICELQRKPIPSHLKNVPVDDSLPTIPDLKSKLLTTQQPIQEENCMFFSNANVNETSDDMLNALYSKVGDLRSSSANLATEVWPEMEPWLHAKTTSKNIMLGSSLPAVRENIESMDAKIAKVRCVRGMLQTQKNGTAPTHTETVRIDSISMLQKDRDALMKMYPSVVR